MNRSLMLRPAKLLGPAAAALSLVMLAAGPAAAAPSLAQRVGSEVHWAALPATSNEVFVVNNSGEISIFDAAGIIPGFGCRTSGSNQVNCGPLATTTRLRMSAGDGNDSVTLGFFTALPVPGVIDGGSGQDRIRGGSRGDRLSDPNGWPSPQSQDTFVGNAGNDTILSRNGGYDRIDCGDGFDTVIADSAARDVVLNCENVIRF
ncbi:hypothetical protein MTF65_14800 [Streptomyces sp. APSN-46.1]|uniref:hypothetical protein n=1 Tax=Streptomyces sp. APSN-46.1 TaxID=2929049 RepID=UPI001FB4FB4B|nr:hypothetical protein [Streptomyces sp. APSN-46.1]MCJ1678595.1 hypothetical protein [Streptomyces sp. APSN-46.1]